MKAIDIHSHFLPAQWEDLSAKFGGTDWPSMQQLGDGKGMLMKGGHPYRPVYSACWDAATTRGEMVRDGIYHQFISVKPLLYA